MTAFAESVYSPDLNEAPKAVPAPAPQDWRFEDGPFLLFAGQTYYPWGGFNDFIGSFDSPFLAMKAIPKYSDWWHIVKDNRIIAES